MLESDLVIRRLYGITSDYSAGFESQTRALLQLGCERFGLDIGILARVQRETYEVLDVVAPSDLGLHSGQRFELGKTYCSMTLASHGPLAHEHIGESELATHPAYREFHLESYIGTPVVVGGMVFGTLNFSSFSPKNRKFSDADIDAIQLMSTWIAAELDRREKEGALEEARQNACLAVEQRDRFLAILSHELRNPLGTIRNAASLLKACPSEAEAATETICEQSDQMARLLEDLLDVARFTSGKIRIRKEPLELNELADHQIRLAARYQERRDHRLEFVRHHEPIWLSADRSRIVQILENLLTNALKYSPPGSDVTVRIGRDEQIAFIRVSDNGCGMTPAMIRGVFDMFVQADISLEHREGGMGLGLTLVRELTKLHGGTVTAESDGLGCGSHFTVRLPGLCEAMPESESNDSCSAGSETARKIVLVEDNDASRDMLRLLLDSVGHEVLVAADGEQGLELILSQRPQLALIDIGLPKLNGFEVARRVRKVIGEDIRLFALTGYGRSEDSEKVTAAGFDLHLVKPISIDKLLVSIASHSIKCFSQEVD